MAEGRRDESIDSRQDNGKDRMKPKTNYWPLLWPVAIIGMALYAWYILVVGMIVMMWPIREES